MSELQSEPKLTDEEIDQTLAKLRAWRLEYQKRHLLGGEIAMQSERCPSCQTFSCICVEQRKQIATLIAERDAFKLAAEEANNAMRATVDEYVKLLEASVKAERVAASMQAADSLTPFFGLNSIAHSEMKPVWKR